MDYSKQVLLELLENNDNIHFPAGPLYSRTHKAKALVCLEDHELSAVYNLVESHSPAVRFSAVHEYEKSQIHSTDELSLNSNNLNFNCSYVAEDTKIKQMLNQLKEMPTEWTIVQLTSQYSTSENYEVDPNKLQTNALHLTVMSCGENQTLPFVITLDPPYDTIADKVIEVRQEMQSIIDDNVKSLKKFQEFLGKRFQGEMEKMIYTESRYAINRRIENVVKLLQDKWLGIWKCLLIGKYVEEDIEVLINNKIEEVLNSCKCTNVSKKNKYMLKCLVKGDSKYSICLRNEALHYLFPNEEHKSLRRALSKMSQNLNKEYKLPQKLCHPIILIVDEKLDNLPWEMIDQLQDHPVSRMPSLHFTYALFKEHESSIINGVKINSQNGSYIINPGLDLKAMEIRLHNFFKHWLPTWSGLVGVKPTEDDFKNLLTNNDIFIYSGHGNGTQFFASEKIKKLKINAVILLFGCGSVQMESLGPQIEMFSSYQMYMIACSPCIVGMLWTVTDSDTDILTTEFLSQWLPSKSETHWKLINKKQWLINGKIEASDKESIKISKHEPDLLRALSIAKKAPKQYITRAACIARGLPVKVV